MNAIPITPATLEVARRVIWFEPPEKALADPLQFMAYAMTYALHQDMRVIRQFVSDHDFREALDNAPPGIIDPRSWAYWNSKMGRYPAPPMPKRTFGGLAPADRSAATQSDLTGASDRAGKPDAEQLRRQAQSEWQQQRLKSVNMEPEEVRRRAREEWLAKYGPKESG